MHLLSFVSLFATWDPFEGLCSAVFQTDVFPHTKYTNLLFIAQTNPELHGCIRSVSAYTYAALSFTHV